MLLTIFSPLFFLGGALPGGEGMVLNWFKRQAAALLAIPMVALFVNLSFKIGFSQFDADNWPANLSDGFPSPWPVVGGLTTAVGFTLLPPLVGIGIFFFATKVPDIVDELFGIKELGARKGIGPGIIAAPIMLPAKAISPLSRAPAAAAAAHNIAASIAERGGAIGRIGGFAQKFTGPISKSMPYGKETKTAQEATPQEREEQWTTVKGGNPPGEKKRPERPF